ncbi:SEL1-like repeat protein [Undibacterium sp. JH2W]|uniref:SEL1-like repeat protein n=1 Tax=Undibacterium sp. JH2W TaxID=3413037 RepID=UPI003BF5C8FC
MAENIDDTMELPSLLLHYDYSARKRRCNCLKKENTLIYTYYRKSDYHFEYLKNLSVMFPTVRFLLFEESPGEWGASRVRRMINGSLIDDYMVCDEKRYFVLYFHPEVFYQWFRSDGPEERAWAHFLRTLPYEFMDSLPLLRDLELYEKFSYQPAPYNPEAGYQLKDRIRENPAFYGWTRCPLKTRYVRGDALLDQLIKVRELEFSKHLQVFDKHLLSYQRLVDLYLMRGNLDTAVAVCKNLLEIFYSQQDQNRAIHGVNKVLKVLVPIYLDYGLYKDGEAVVEQCLSYMDAHAAESEDFINTLIELGKIYRAQNQYTQFPVLYERGLKHYADREILVADDVSSLLKFSMCCAEMQLFQQAEELIRKADCICSKNNLPCEESRLIEIEIVKADVFQLQGRKEDAISAYRRALEGELKLNGNKPDFLPARKIRTAMLKLQGQTELAREMLTPFTKHSLEGLDENYLKDAGDKGDLDAQLLMADIKNIRDPHPSDEFPLPYVWEFYESNLVYWYGKAAAQGNAMAQCHMGDMYRLGMGVLHDFKIAMDWYRKSAEQGHILAMMCLGMMYKNGLGVERNLQQAREWFERYNSKWAEQYMETRIFELFDETGSSSHAPDYRKSLIEKMKAKFAAQAK